MTTQGWIVDCLKMCKISNKVIKFTTETMKNLENAQAATNLQNLKKILTT